MSCMYIFLYFSIFLGQLVDIFSTFESANYTERTLGSFKLTW